MATLYTLEVPEALVAALEEEARVEGISQAAILEQAFEHYRRVMHQRRLGMGIKQLAH